MYAAAVHIWPGRCVWVCFVLVLVLVGDKCFKKGRKSLRIIQEKVCIRLNNLNTVSISLKKHIDVIWS